MLVPQDIRERKGAYFTPREWVELSQKYIADVLGEDWQEEYYVWDCAAGTGNLLAGLTNKYNIWASTLEMADVNVIHENIDQKTSLLLKDHVFQFDFLNDDFSKLPQPLQDIINNEEKRKKLVIYINPPYAEATSTKTISNENSQHKENIGKSKIKDKYEKILNQASKELYVLFLFRIYKEIEGCFIANFSKIKTIQGNHYKEFRNLFLANLEKLFIVPADTFDNVKGKFPIGFFIWNTKTQSLFKYIYADVYNNKGILIQNKYLFVPENKNIKDWLRNYNFKDFKFNLGYLVRGSADIQNNNVVFITLNPSESVLKASNANVISEKNLIENCIFLSVRKVIEQTWINDRDQYLFPNDYWKDDLEFKSDCLTYSIFNTNIESNKGINHWIPFTEEEVDAREKFESNFMTQYIKGKIRAEDDNKDNLFEVHEPKPHYEVPLLFSEKAQAVFDAGRALWKYYHAQKFSSFGGVSEGRGGYNVNASLYDIRDYFQGRNDKGKMNSKSTDEDYNLLIKNLRKSLKILAKKIEPKVYEYGFLKE